MQSIEVKTKKVNIDIKSDSYYILNNIIIVWKVIVIMLRLLIQNLDMKMFI